MLSYVELRKPRVENAVVVPLLLCLAKPSKAASLVVLSNRQNSCQSGDFVVFPWSYLTVESGHFLCFSSLLSCDFPWSYQSVLTGVRVWVLTKPSKSVYGRLYGVSIPVSYQTASVCVGVWK